MPVIKHDFLEKRWIANKISKERNTFNCLKIAVYGFVNKVNLKNPVGLSI